MKYLTLFLALLVPLFAAKPIESLSSADLQSLKAALNLPVANVRDFGATGDGTTDDTAAIAAASLSLRTTGGTLYFPKGTYLVRETTDLDGIPWGVDAYGSDQLGPRPMMQVFSNMVIAGDGMGASIIKAKSTAGVNPMIHLNTASNVVFRDLTLDGNKSRFGPPYGGEAEGIDTKDDCRQLYIERCQFKNFPHESIDLDNSEWDLQGFQVFIRGCLFEDGGGEAIHNPNWAVVENCRFIRMGHDRWQNATDGDGDGSQGQGAIDGAGHNMIVRNCYFKGCTRAIHIYRKIGDTSNTYLGFATGTLTFTGLPSVGETVTIGGQVYTFAPAGKSFTADQTTDVFTSTSHGYSDGTAVQLLLIEGSSSYAENTTCYIRDATTNTFKIAATAGGAAIDIVKATNSPSVFGRISSDWPVAGEVEIGSDAANSVILLSHAVNGGTADNAASTTARATYAAPSAASGTPSILQLTALAQGADGNAVTLSESASNCTASGATFSGGGTANESVCIIDGVIVEDSQAAGSPYFPYAIETYTVDNVTVSNFKITGHSRALSVGGVGSTIRDGRVTMTSNLVDSVAVRMGSANGLVTGLYLRGGLLEIGAAGVTVTGSDISSAYGAVYCNGASIDDVKLIGNTLATAGNIATGAAGTEAPVNFATAGITGAMVLGNRITGGNRGMRIQSDSTVAANVVSGVAFYAIELVGTGNTVTTNQLASSSTLIQNTGIVNTMTANRGTGLPLELYGTGSPEGVVAAPVGSTYRRTDGGAGTSIYQKEANTTSAGWVAK
jgi:hypothetical protein